MNSGKEVHLNESQQMYTMVLPNRCVAICPRGWGKTRGLNAVFTAENAISMPRSTGRLGSYTYEGLLTNILPGIIQGWEEVYNWKEGVHFFVGKWAPKSYQWDRPHFSSQSDAKHLVHIYDGSVIQLASMDRSINNGASIDWFSLDEARLVRRKRVAEMIPAMRGNLAEFGHLSNYQSLLMISDMPQIPSEKWLLDYEDQNTQELIDGIMNIHQYMADTNLVQRYLKTTSKKYKKKLEIEINHWQREMNRLRLHCTMFIEPSIFENIDALGVRALMNMKETLTDQEFAVSVLNQRRDKVLNGFYASLDPEAHSYDGQLDYSRFDGIEDVHRVGYQKDCRMDGDYFPEQPLHIGFDHNAAINTLLIGQTRGKTERHVIKEMFVKQPKYLTDLIEQFTEYYRFAKNKNVIYYYDSTSIKNDSRGNPSEENTVVNLLHKAGWKVRKRFLGGTMRSNEKYRLWQSVNSGTHPSGIVWKYNRVNCMNMEKSMLNADVRMVGDEYRKDKRSEQKDYAKGEYKVPQENATHMTEAGDTLLIGWLEDMTSVSIFSSPVSG
jgi:hypothetical protein